MSRGLGDVYKRQDVIEKAILFFRDNGIKGERFAETIERIGFENVEKQLLEQL